MEKIREKIKNAWYKDGLRFECNQCGICCRGDGPGAVWVSEDEINAIAAYLKISVEIFKKKFVRQILDRFSLVERSNYDCVMYENGCSIYSVRPYQCRTFPFWLANIETCEEWETLKSHCPGVGKGKLYTRNEIMEIICKKT